MIRVGLGLLAFYKVRVLKLLITILFSIDPKPVLNLVINLSIGKTILLDYELLLYTV